MRNFPYHSTNNNLLLCDSFNSLIPAVFSVSDNNLPSNSDLELGTPSSFFQNVPFPTSRTVYYDQFLDIR